MATIRPSAPYLVTSVGENNANTIPTMACTIPIEVTSLPDRATPYTNASVMPFKARKAVYTQKAESAVHASMLVPHRLPASKRSSMAV